MALINFDIIRYEEFRMPISFYHFPSFEFGYQQFLDSQLLTILI